MAKYLVNVQDIVQRQLVIKQKQQTPIRREKFYHYVPQGIDLDVIQVDIDLPVYRLANWRTRTRQLEHVHREHHPNSFFETGEEDVAPQRAQHEFLIDFAKRGRGESIVPIWQKLANDRRQTETLLLTSTGVVLNGNRRLAAMRELWKESATDYPFQAVEAAILPAGVTPPELKKIEFRLQMQQETKLPYEWAVQCIAVRELHQAGTGKPEIMHLMQLGREAEVQAMIDRINEAEMYLNDYLDTPEEYAAVEHQEQQFIELQRALDRKNDEGERELARRLCHVITKHSRDLETRAYDFKIAFGAKSLVVAERLAERFDIPVDEPAAAPADNGDVFADYGAVASPSARFAPVREVLADKGRSQELAEAIRDICTEIREEDQDEDKAKKPLKDVKRAKTILSRLDLAQAGDDTLTDVRSELEQVSALALGLIEKLDERAGE